MDGLSSVGARSETICVGSLDDLYMAALQGNVSMVKYCVENDCLVNAHTCSWVLSSSPFFHIKTVYVNK